MAEPKIDHDRSTSIIDENIGSLEVFVADAEQMEAVYGMAQSTEERDEPRPRPGVSNA
jgi:hypothetical protein